MNKWECLRLISEQGIRQGSDTILQLLEWCDRPNTASVTDEEAEAFLTLLTEKQNAPAE